MLQIICQAVIVKICAKEIKLCAIKLFTSKMRPPNMK